MRALRCMTRGFSCGVGDASGRQRDTSAAALQGPGAVGARAQEGLQGREEARVRRRRPSPPPGLSAAFWGISAEILHVCSVKSEAWCPGLKPCRLPLQVRLPAWVSPKSLLGSSWAPLFRSLTYQPEVVSPSAVALKISALIIAMQDDQDHQEVLLWQTRLFHAMSTAYTSALVVEKSCLQ